MHRMPHLPVRITLGLLGTATALKIIIIAIILADVQELVSGKIVSYPPTRYVFERNEGRLRCQNRSEDETEFYNYIRDALWYRLFPNGTVHEIGANGPVFVRTYSLFFHPFVRLEDQGIYYCCKPGGSCSGNSTVAIAVAPAIEVVKKEYVSTIRSNVTLSCHITNRGIPLATFGWRRRGLWLSRDSISMNSTHFSLKLLNLSDDDAGRYSCAAEGVLSLHIKDVSVFIKVPPVVVMRGPTDVKFGSNVSIRCTVLKGYPPPSVSIITPQGETINQSVINFNATMNDAGNYTCIANNSLAIVTRNLSLIVHIAPQPVMSRQWIVIRAGDDIVLPCVIEMAYPPPLYHWQHIAPHEDVTTSDNAQLLNNGSLLLSGVKTPAIYKCIAWNEYGTSIQLIYMTVEDERPTNNNIIMFHVNDPKHNCYHSRSENFKKEISAAFEAYIQDICNCSVTLTNANLICVNTSSALYTVQLMDNQSSLVSTFIYELLEIITMNNGIDLKVAIIKTWTSAENATVTDDDNNDQFSYDWHYILYSFLAILSVVIAVFMFYNSYRCMRNRRGKFYMSDEQASKASISSEEPLVYENNKAETMSPQSAGEPKLQDSIPTNKITTV